MHPSEQCITDLQAQPGGVTAFSGGELKWDSDNKCDDSQKSKFQTAAWDAYILAQFSDREPDGHDAKDIALWETWIGPNYASQQKRIVDGKAVGGYAWTSKGWFGYYYYYITMCNPFFQSDDLMAKIDQIENQLNEGDTEMAKQAVWQKNSGHMFLHEMMHLGSVGQPEIGDQRVGPGQSAPLAYGPYWVNRLARLGTNGGGAEIASINADSYAWLANSRYFWDLTGYFPQPRKYKAAEDDGLTAAELTQELDGFLIDFGTITGDTTDSEINDRLDSLVAGYDNPTSPVGPSQGKSLSIAMISVVNSHAGSASLDSEWHFFTTNIGEAVGSCGETDGEELSPRGPSKTEISGDVNLESPPWPAGEYKLNIEGQDFLAGGRVVWRIPSWW
ncbi:Metalloproteases (zincins), catalytic [Stemphylium lycopersici]|uniref:Metalloproteases (Zincins), catalytic n=1 Tax=Stemphylium lycopersici TaxID=183478 RepID=A0A364NGK7_STELY|nr:Metalloproteases (zincins), catalytic [Stemphylium lycopersici]